MGMFNIDEKADKAIDYEYRGIVFKVKVIPDISGWHKSLSEILVKNDIGEKELGEEENKERAEMFAGIAMVGNMVVGCDIESMPDDNGVDQSFNFDDPIDHEVYETMGEALLGSNPVLQNQLYNYCLKLAKTPPDYEVRALGKSLKLLDSGDSETKKEI